LVCAAGFASRSRNTQNELKQLLRSGLGIGRNLNVCHKNSTLTLSS